MVDGAAGDEITMRRNEAALAAIELVPKLLEGAPKRDQSVELFGLTLPSPVIIGPTGLAGPLLAACRTRRGAGGGAVRNDLFDQPRLDLDHRGDRRGDPGPEMDAGLSLQGSGLDRRIRRASRRRRDTRR